MSDIQYTLTATVDGEVVFENSYLDTTDLIEEIYKAEGAVESSIEMELEPDEEE